MSDAALNAEPAWQVLEGVDPAGAFPVRAKLGDETILVFKTPTGFRGAERTCPHQQASMLNATPMGGGAMLRCPLHNFIFRLSDGKGVNCPGLNMKVYDVRLVDGRLEGALPG